MSTAFDTALNDIFDGRQEGFSKHLKGLLRELYERGAKDKEAPKATPTAPVGEHPGTEHVDVGKEITSIAALRPGDRFQNQYLRGEGQYRVVVKRHHDTKKNGARITHLTTNLVRAKDKKVIREDDPFDQAKLEQYKPYKRIK